MAATIRKLRLRIRRLEQENSDFRERLEAEQLQKATAREGVRRLEREVEESLKTRRDLEHEVLRAQGVVEELLQKRLHWDCSEHRPHAKELSENQ